MTININFNLPFNEAIQQMASRGVVLPEVYYGQLQGIHRQLAFSIANITKVDQLQSVLDSLTTHLKDGGTFAQWQKAVDVKALGLPKHRLDNIFRTNIQQAYNHGHWQQALANQATHGYLMYDAINDSRTRPSHRANDGIIRKIDDPIWKRIWFSRSVYRCRCRLISLTEKQAIARSANDQGLYKTATEDPLRDKAWDDVDVFHEDFLQVGIDKAIASRLANPKVNPVLKSAFNNTISDLPNMKIIALEGFSTVQKALSELAVKKPEWFSSGFNGIHAVANGEFFAANHNGTIYFSDAVDGLTGFKPATNLMSAFEKSATNSVISFNEEYAVETLWHELMHTRALHDGFDNKNLAAAVEGIHQWLSRRTYQQLIAESRLAAPIHQNSIINGGFSYQAEVYNFSKLLTILGVQSADVVDEIEKIWLSGMTAREAKMQVAGLLAAKSQIKDSRINKALSYLSVDSSDFSAKTKQIVSY